MHWDRAKTKLEYKKPYETLVYETYDDEQAFSIKTLEKRHRSITKLADFEHA